MWWYVAPNGHIHRMRGAPLPLKAIYEASAEMERVVNVNYPTTAFYQLSVKICQHVPPLSRGLLLGGFGISFGYPSVIINAGST